MTKEDKEVKRNALQAENPFSGIYIDLVWATWQPAWENGV